MARAGNLRAFNVPQDSSHAVLKRSQYYYQATAERQAPRRLSLSLSLSETEQSRVSRGQLAVHIDSGHTICIPGNSQEVDSHRKLTHNWP
mmetsp:Transcript_16986/g.47434  ORF Transcript_16986/g.47434 Transcript_16986/m.47434 type:complete len:90 (-) Transcript_16986:1041-1310(-)